MTELALAPVSIGRRLAALAEEHPDGSAMTYAPADGPERLLSWLELDRWTNRLARLLAALGVDEGSTLVVELPTSLEHYAVTIGGWKLGAMVLPVSAKLPAGERDAILALAEPTLVVADREGLGVLRPGDLPAEDQPSDPLPDVIASPGKAIASGGSTGRPKIIVDPNPLAYAPGVLEDMIRTWAGVGCSEAQLVSGPLYHNAPFSWSMIGLFLGHHLIVMDRFDAERAVQLVEQHRVTFLPLVPTTMQRILRLPDLASHDLSSVRSVFHTAAPCPAWVKRGWIDLVGGEHVYEVFGATEAVGLCLIRGDEWLGHPGSVGRPATGTEIRILDEEGKEVPTGEVGEIYMRRQGATTYFYKGSPPARSTPNGFTSVGDLGSLDADGYLYLADRRADLIISGGANVYPAEVELALAEHAGVCDSAVVGLPSDEWGKSVHAIVQPCNTADPPSIDELERHCRERLAAHKVPKSWEFVDDLARDEAGKVRRSALAAARAFSPAPAARDGATESRTLGRRRLVGVALLLLLIGVVIGGLRLLGADGGRSGPRIPSLGVSDPRTSGLDLSDEPALGPPDAPVVMIEFNDYACEFCARYHRETFDELLRRNEGRLLYVVRHFPLSDVHPFAAAAAEAAECAHEQGRFWQFHRKLMTDPERIRPDQLKQAAEASGLDTDRFDECLDSGATASKVNRDTVDGRLKDVRGTPTFLINGRRIEGAKPIDELQRVIDEASAAK